MGLPGVPGPIGQPGPMVSDNSWLTNIFII